MTKLKVLILSTLSFALFSGCQNKLTPAEGKPTEKSAPVGFVNEPNTLMSQQRQLTFVGPKSGEGYFSPDGKMMIFQSERHEGNPFYQMYLMNLETGKTTMVSPGQGKTTCGWIHPSMKKVLFSSTHLDPESAQKAKAEYESRQKAVKARYSWSFDDTYDIFSSNLEGKNLKRLTKEKGYDAEASYSPDGQWIAFASNRSGYTEKLEGEDKKFFEQDQSYMMDIYIMKADGTGVRRLTTSKGYDGGPFFSADGKKITWRRFAPNGATAEIYTMNVDGSEQTQVTRLKSMSWAPFFHPSGDYLIFGSSVLGYSNFELFIVDAKGRQEPVRVTFNEGFDGLPVFTPDGNKLSWTHRGEKGESQILISDWDDNLARKLLKLPSQDPADNTLQPEIRLSDMKKWISYLASEDLAGRRTGGEEEKIYSEKIAQVFKSWGLTGAGPNGSFVIPFEFTSGVELGQKNSMDFVGSYAKSLVLGKDFQPLSFSKPGAVREAPLVFAGYGIKAPASDKIAAYNSYEGLDVHGKWVVIFSDLPADISPEKRQYFNLYSRLLHKLTVAKNEGAVGVIVTAGPTSGIKDSFGAIKYEGALAEGSLAVIRLSTESAVELFRYAKKDLQFLQTQLDKGLPTEGFVLPSVYLKAQVDLQFKKAQGLNVVAQLKVPGAKTGVLIGAHGDHLGHGEIGNSLAKTSEKVKTHYGADDNASGVAGVMELAHYYSDMKNKKPGQLKKNLYFAVWSGEELGNLGSSYFVQNWKKTNNGREIKQDISAYLNMDMIGRLKDRLFVQGLGSGTNWHPLAEEVAVRTAVPMTVQDDPYLPTDSLALYLAEVPVVNLFTGAHEDYHSPRDTAEKINYQGVERVIQVARNFVDLLSDSSQILVKYVKVQGTKNKLEGRTFRIFLGTIPDYTQEGVKGVRISGASKGSPAEVAGLREKDIITEFDGTKIENLYDYVYTLQSVKPNKETVMKLVRDGQAMEVKITPKLKE